MATVKDLQEMAREMEIEGRSNMSKSELEEAIHVARVQQLLDNNTLEDLHEDAAREEIGGRSSMNKEELAEALVLQMELEELESEGEDEEDDRLTPAATPSALRNLAETEAPPEEVSPDDPPAQTQEEPDPLRPRRLIGEPRAGARGEVRGSRTRQGPVTRQRTIGKTAR